MAVPKRANKSDTVNADLNNRDDYKGQLKTVGGSQSDKWNRVLANQTMEALWVNNSAPQHRQQQYEAAVAALRGIEPKNELEGMLAAQLIAAHNAAMECYRRAMIGEQTFEGRRENLSQANKLSRTYVALLDALNRHRGKGQQKVTVEHVHVNAGGQAVVGVVQGPGDRRKTDAVSKKADEQSEAKQIAHAPQPVMTWNAHPDRELVRVSADRRMVDTEKHLPDQASDGHRRPDAGASDAKSRAVRG